jgi:hypothetical protein
MKKRLLPLLMLVLLTSMSFAQNHTIKVTVPSSTIVCYAIGAFNNWDPTTSIKMNKISDSPKMFSSSIDFGVPDTSLKTVEYKFLSGPDWKYQQTASANFKYLVDSASAVVDSFQHIYSPNMEKDVIIDVLVPDSVYVLNITGTFNSWNPTANPMTKVDSTINGKEYKLTIHTLDTTTLEFKFVAGPGWSYEQSSATNYNYMSDGGTVTCDLFKAVLNPAKVGDITVNITVPIGTPDVYLIGDFNNWSTTTNYIHATKITDTTYTAVIPLVQVVQFKCYNYPDWAYEEAVDAAGNSLPENRSATYATSHTINAKVAFWKAVHSPGYVPRLASSSYKIYTNKNSIVVEGIIVSHVDIFDITGRLIVNVRANGTFTSNNLRSGVYIVRVDDQVRKVVIR